MPLNYFLNLNSMDVLLILVWIGVPILSLGMFFVLPRYLEEPSQKKLAKVGGLGVFLAPWIISSGVKWYYDQQVQELCAKDGGIKVYETVTLPVDMFNHWGQPNFYQPNQGLNALGEEYIFKVELPDYQNVNNPKITRSRSMVIRRADNKLLGEIIIYGRSGGDFPGPWHGSGFNCPNFSEGEISLFRAVFLKSN